MKKQALRWKELYAWLFLFTPILAVAVPLQAPARNEAVRKVSASMVLLSGSDDKGSVISGTGFIAQDEVVVTSYDFAKDATSINAVLPGGETRSARLFGINQRRDVALLKVTGVAVAEPPRFSAESQLAQGDRVYVVSNLEPAGAHSRRANVGNPVVVRGRPYMSIESAGSGAVNGNPVLDQSGALTGILDIVVENGSPVAFVVPAYSIASLLILAGISHVPIGGVPGGSPLDIAESRNAPPGGSDAGPSLPKIIRKSGGVLMGNATRRVEPQYPPAAKAIGLSGSVVVEVTIDEDGYVTMASAVSGHPLLKEPAVAAAMGWKFVPTKLQGQPIKVIGTITFNFQM